jgi:FtsZ-binding cell division protein ZapB
MGLFDKKELEEEVSKLRGKVEFLEHQNEAIRTHNDTLIKMVDRLQEALIAKESPAAYEQMMLDKHEEKNPLTEEQKKKLKLEHETYNWMAAEEERPLFDNAEDMVDRLRTILGTPELESIHGNDES